MAIGVEIDQLFLIFMGMIIFFMQCGFAFLEAGAVRSKNVTNILIKNVFDSFVSGVAYWIIGYAFAFGDGNDFIGHKYFASYELPETQYAAFFFQYTFAATAATIVSGAVAERCEFLAYFVYSFFITGFIYPVVTHWVWGGGFLAKGKDYGGDIGQIAYQDFAGSGVVHCLGGTAAFVGALLLGPRIGRFHKETKTVIQIRGHSVPIAALGGFILFFGFLAFNGGSQTSISNPGDGAAISLSVVNTIISASFAAFSSLIINRSPLFGNRSWSLLITINGALTGMVAACAGCNVMYTYGACAIGCISGISFHLWSWIVRSLKIDDPLDAVAVHFGGGSWGVIALAFFHKEDGIFYNWDKRSGMFFAWQLAGLAAITAWAAVMSLIVFGILRLLKVLRVPEDIEHRGLDIPKHNEPAYPVEAYGHGHIENILQIFDKSGPVKVTQAFEKMNGNVNSGYEEVADQGPYESPEVKRQIHQLEQNGGAPSANYVPERAHVQERRVPVQPAQPMQIQEPVYFQEPVPRGYVQQPRYYSGNQQPYYVVQPIPRESFRYH
ncbi:putative ammonium transporter 1 isoform X2 [Ruditapes philippinarum]|uniref:putative ammonium transporter 1 isoform X2 n=1 Tax=Ruditapes philippinarum TaxID=129788 RepID=UPI00295ADE7F|nr:putative ammonium transporter 1 isoform X2 [Ruditapes philippinarum]